VWEGGGRGKSIPGRGGNRRAASRGTKLGYGREERKVTNLRELRKRETQSPTHTTSGIANGLMELQEELYYYPEISLSSSQLFEKNRFPEKS